MNKEHTKELEKEFEQDKCSNDPAEIGTKCPRCNSEDTHVLSTGEILCLNEKCFAVSVPEKDVQNQSHTLKCSECGERFPYESHEHICRIPNNQNPEIANRSDTQNRDAQNQSGGVVKPSEEPSIEARDEVDYAGSNPASGTLEGLEEE